MSTQRECHRQSNKKGLIMIDRSPETIIIKLVFGIGGLAMLASALGWVAAVGFTCLLSVFTYELRTGKIR